MKECQELEELLGEYKMALGIRWWYQRTEIEKILKEIGCPPIFIEIFFDNIKPFGSWWYQRPQIEKTLNKINSPEILNEMIMEKLR